MIRYILKLLLCLIYKVNLTTDMYVQDKTVFTGFGTGLGQANAAGKAVEAVGRQPEAGGAIRSTMIMGQAVAETTAFRLQTYKLLF